MRDAVQETLNAQAQRKKSRTPRSASVIAPENSDSTEPARLLLQPDITIARWDGFS